MAIAFVQTGSEGRTTGTGTAVSNLSTNPVSGNVLVAYVATWKATAALVTSIADNKSNVWTRQASKLGTNGAGVEIWTAPVTATGASFSVTLTATTGHDLNIRVVEYSGVSATLDKTANNVTGSPGTTLTVTTPTLTSANELICAVVSAGTTSLTAATSGYTNRGLQASGASIQAYAADDKIVAATTAVTASYTFAAIGGGAEVQGLIATFAQSAGGTVFNDTMSETATAADTFTGLRVSTNAVPEAGTAAETPAALLVASNTLAETGAASDTVTGGLAFANSLNEAGTAADSPSAALVVSASLAETGTAAEALTGSLGINASVNETGTAADTPAGLLSIAASVSETGSAVDTTGGGSLYAVSLAETGTAADTPSAALSVTASVAETGSANDTVSAVATSVGAVAETGSASDAVASTRIAVNTVSEAGSAVDTVGFIASQVYNDSVSEAASAADTTDATGGKSTTVIPEDPGYYWARINTAQIFDEYGRPLLDANGDPLLGDASSWDSHDGPGEEIQDPASYDHWLRKWAELRASEAAKGKKSKPDPEAVEEVLESILPVLPKGDRAKAKTAIRQGLVAQTEAAFDKQIAQVQALMADAIEQAERQDEEDLMLVLMELMD